MMIGQSLMYIYVQLLIFDYHIVENPDPEGKFDYPREIVIHTEGSNLQEILQIPEIDITRTMSNHIVEIEEIFGIEVAREMIIRELYSNCL